ncbi:MAG TPA: hypothetical protein VMU28_10285 [Terriglobales bacterium]|nr:hypothetical protein [Terriglobales bacterium]
MTQRDPNPGKPVEKGPKKPYVKPAYESSQIFETLALACGKLSVTQQQCRFNRKVS